MLTTFLGLPNSTNPKITFIPICWERSTSFIKGTVNAPYEIIQLSNQLEDWDYQTNIDLSSVPVATSEFLFPSTDASEGLKSIATTVFNIISRSETLPVVIGGEHSLSIGVAQALKDKGERFGFIYLDAHCDTRKIYQKDHFSHACTARRIFEQSIPIAPIGIRAFSLEELNFLKEHSIPFTTADKLKLDFWEKEVESILYHMPNKIYLSIDFDFLDPSVIPCVGTPEPGGIGWKQAISIIEKIIRRKEVIALDFVELSPRETLKWGTYTATKLIYKSVNIWLKKENRDGS